MRRVGFVLLLVVVSAASIVQTSAQNVTAGVCSGYQSVISSGIQAKVAPGASNRIRRSPGLDAERLGEMPAGSVMAILSGPTCADGYTWWMIRFGTIFGWTAEGQDTTHWIQPSTAESHAPKQPPGSLGGTSVSVLYSFGLCISSDVFALNDAFARGTESSLSHTETFVLGEDELKVEPGACAPVELQNDITVVSPFAVEMPADVEIFGDLGFLRATLPDIAYTIPGLWSLRVRGYLLQIDIQAPSGPFMQGLYESASGNPGEYRLILGGFQPGERIVIVTSATTSRAVAYQAAEGEIFPEIDSNTGIGTMQLDPAVIDIIIDSAYLDPLSDFSDRSFTLVPEVAVLDGAVLEMDVNTTSEIGKLLFDPLTADISVIEGLGMTDPSGSTNGIFGVTFENFSGIQVTADGGGFAFGTFALGGAPIAAIGEFRSMAIWTNLADLSVPGAPGDAETLRQTLWDAYWAGDESTALPCEYTIERGDTLNRVARRYGVTLEELLAVNPQIENPDVIRRGLVVTIPNCTP
jgi:hypothetical protein